MYEKQWWNGEVDYQTFDREKGKQRFTQLLSLNERLPRDLGVHHLDFTEF